MKRKRRIKKEIEPTKNESLPAVKMEAEQNKPLTLGEIEERLSNTILASSLALKVLKGVRKPTSQLIQELLDIEFQVGHFVGEAMKIHVEQMRAPNLRGVLANALSTMPLGGPKQNISAADGPIPASNKKGTKKRVRRKNKKKVGRY